MDREETRWLGACHMKSSLPTYWMCNPKCVKVAQSCPTLCNPMDCSLPRSSVHGILQTRILQWVAVPFSRGSSQPTDQTQISHIAGRFFTSWATGKPEKMLPYLLTIPDGVESNTCPSALWCSVPRAKRLPGRDMVGRKIRSLKFT